MVSRNSLDTENSPYTDEITIEIEDFTPLNREKAIELEIPTEAIDLIPRSQYGSSTYYINKENYNIWIEWHATDVIGNVGREGIIVKTLRGNILIITETGEIMQSEITEETKFQRNPTFIRNSGKRYTY